MEQDAAAAWESFRAHRHEVLNGLQMVKAYLQMGRGEDAHAWVNRLAAWLHSLSLWQARLEAEDHEVLWTVARCPRVTAVELWPKRKLARPLAAALADAWRWLDEQAAAHNTACVWVRGEAVVSGADGIEQVRLHLEASGGPSFPLADAPTHANPRVALHWVSSIKAHPGGKRHVCR